LHMKKGRPGLRLEALTTAGALGGVVEAIYRNTPSIGVRYWPVTRPSLPRREDVTHWKGQRIRVKRVSLPGGAERVKPEFEDVLRAAQALGVPPLEIVRGLGGQDAT